MECRHPGLQRDHRAQLVLFLLRYDLLNFLSRVYDLIKKTFLSFFLGRLFLFSSRRVRVRLRLLGRLSVLLRRRRGRLIRGLRRVLIRSRLRLGRSGGPCRFAPTFVDERERPAYERHQHYRDRRVMLPVELAQPP